VPAAGRSVVAWDSEGTRSGRRDQKTKTKKEKKKKRQEGGGVGRGRGRGV
jgi:hypothetical protein